MAFCSNLLYLNLRHNRLNAFPESVCSFSPYHARIVTHVLQVLHLRNLQILDLSHNSITSIPDGIKMMFSLMFLAAEKNQIERLPLCIGEMSRLTKIKVEANPIEFPPPEVFVPSTFGSSPGGHPMEEARQICSQVKSFLHEAAVRERSGGSGSPRYVWRYVKYLCSLFLT